jgi:hypothetical protein
MAQQEKPDEVREEIDADDELDGWGPVRVRRSTVPSAPRICDDALSAHSSDSDQQRNDPSTNKALMT